MTARSPRGKSSTGAPRRLGSRQHHWMYRRAELLAAPAPPVPHLQGRADHQMRRTNPRAALRGPGSAAKPDPRT